MEPSYDTETTYGMRNALRAVLLFHGGIPWDKDKIDEWRRLTGTTEATTTVLCKLVRAALSIGCSGNCGEEGERLWGVSPGHVLTEKDVEDIKHIISDHNDQIADSAESFHLGRIDAWRSIGGDELVEKNLKAEEAERDEIVERAMDRFRDQLGR